MFVPTPIQPPESPRVRELSQRIRQLIADFQRQYPMTPGEIRQALLHAAGGVGGGYPRRFVAILVGGLAAVLGVGVFASRSVEGGANVTWAPILVAIGVVAGAMGLVIAVRRSR